MSPDLEIYKKRRVVMVRLERAAKGDPDEAIPQPDDRGYSGSDTGPIFGVLQGETVKLRLRRENIDRKADLYVTSSDPKAFKVVNPPSTALLPKKSLVYIKIKGEKGGKPKVAKLEVRYCTSASSPFKGPVIHEGIIWVWDPPLDLKVTPHLVTIRGATPKPAYGSSADVGKIVDVAEAIWRPCGIRLLPSKGGSFAKATQTHTIQLASPGVVKLEVNPGGEVDKVLALGNVPHTVNAYFIREFSKSGVLGLGISPATQAAWGLGKNGILLADRTTVGGKVVNHDNPWSGNDLAHEIGHFLTLKHVENLNAGSTRNDTWSRRCLMHAENLLPAVPERFKTDIGYGALSLLGSMRGRRGGLITMKDLAQLVTDGECSTARGKVSSI